MHTQGKWTVDKSGLRIRSRSGLIATCESEQGKIPEAEHLANAQRICHCVNNFDELVEACQATKEIIGYIAQNYKKAPHFTKVERLIDTALAKAERIE